MKLSNDLVKVHSTVLFISGLFIMLTAIVAITGYLLDVRPLRDWYMVTEMALPTAVCFLAIGFNMVFLAIRLNGNP